MIDKQTIKDIIEHIGENPNSLGVIETPKRVLNSYKEIYSGYKVDFKKLIKTFPAKGLDQIILCKDIEFYSMCEHHMLPFVGKAHVAYIPDNTIIGLSKLARILDGYARRLQIQERIGEQVTRLLMDELKPLGAACVIEAEHFCMRMRGVSKQNSKMVTSSMKGVFMEKHSARSELMSLIKM